MYSVQRLVVALIVVFAAVSIFPSNGEAQTARVWEERRAITTYPFSEPNAIPILSRDPRLYPYHSFEGGQKLREQRHLIRAVIDSRKVARHFLKAKHASIAHGLGGVDNARQIDSAVPAFTPAYIPADDSDHLIPARIKDCTNWR